jgi:hypothetical protein
MQCQQLPHVILCLVALLLSPPIMAKLKTDPTNNERAKKKNKNRGW